MMPSLRYGALCVLMHLSFTAHAQSSALDDVLQHVPMASVVALKACGVQSQNAWPELLGVCASSYLVGAGTSYCLKHVVSERRPDGSDCRSFPSGHAMFAFAGAAALRHEYGSVSPWIVVGGYGVAALVSADRVRRDRHYVHDVLAGAAIGTLSTELCYYLKSKLVKTRNLDVAFTGTQLSLSYRW